MDDARFSSRPNSITATAQLVHPLLRLFTLVCLVLACLRGHAAAEVSAHDKAVAEALFDRGLELMRQGKDAEACETLERSQAVEPGVGTMLYLAECYEKVGRTASAWAMYREAASAAQAQGQTDRARKGGERARLLTPKLSKLVLEVAPEAKVEGLVITRNGEEVPSAAYGIALPVDPGVLELVAAAPGHVTWSLTVTLQPNGASLVVDVPGLQPLPPTEVSQQPTAPETAPVAGLSPTATTQPTDGPHSSFHKPLAYALGGAGLLGLAVGSYFGAKAISENNEADSACPNDRCDDQGFAHHESAQRAATASNVLVFGGLALVAAGVVVYVTRPRDDQVRVSVSAGPGIAQLSVRGGF